MIPVRELLQDIDLKLNKVGTTQNQYIPDEDKISFLNDAIINLIKTKFSENNIYKSGLDSFAKRYDDLQSIIETKELELKKGGFNNIYYANIDLPDYKYMFYIPESGYILANKDTCKDRVLTVNLVKHSDVTTVKDNNNTKPSFEYQETIGTITNNKFEVYTDGSFIPSKLYIQYIKYPQKVDIIGYEHLNGSPSINSDSELPYYLKEEIVNIAVRNLAMSIDNQNIVQNTTQRIQNDE